VSYSSVIFILVAGLLPIDLMTFRKAVKFYNTLLRWPGSAPLLAYQTQIGTHTNIATNGFIRIRPRPPALFHTTMIGICIGASKVRTQDYWVARPIARTTKENIFETIIFLLYETTGHFHTFWTRKNFHIVRGSMKHHHHNLMQNECQTQ
jgi:hypothetical protein